MMNGLNMFILEDDENRINSFKRVLGTDNNLIVYNNCHDALEGYKNLKDKIDIMFLDHDLGGQQMVSSFQYNTGYTFASYIAKEATYGHKVVIHSCNPIGSERMYDVLNSSNNFKYKVELYPFPVLIHDLKLLQNKG